jgi:hypothetical protein
VCVCVCVYKSARVGSDVSWRLICCVPTPAFYPESTEMACMRDVGSTRERDGGLLQRCNMRSCARLLQLKRHIIQECNSASDSTFFFLFGYIL